MALYQQVVNAPYKYVQNMEASYSSATVVAMAAGQCRDSTNVFDIFINSAISLDLTKNGINGLDTGTVAVSSIYSIYAIMSPLLSNTQDTSGYIASLNTTNTPFLPPTYSVVRHVAWVVTDSSGNIQKFYQSGHASERTYWYDTAIQTAAITLATSYNTVDLSVGVPPPGGISNREVVLSGAYTPSTAGNSFTLSPTSASIATTPNIAPVSGPVISQAFDYQRLVNVGVSTGKAAVSIKSSSASDTITMFVAGYREYL